MSALMQVGWSLHASVLIGMGLWAAVYILMMGVGRRRYGGGIEPSIARQAVFHFGTVVGLLALVSPLDRLGDEFLFSAHMVQHLLLIYVTAPCWLIGTPDWLPGLILPRRILPGALRILRPASALCVFAGVTLAWHIPGLYDQAQSHEWLHIVQHLTYIGSAILGWWPLLGPTSAGLPVVSPPVRLLYGFLMALPCTFLGALLTFARTPIYAFYMNVAHPFGMGPLEDQQLAGLLMWIPTHMVLLLCLAVIGAKWLNGDGTRSSVSSTGPAD